MHDFLRVIKNWILLEEWISEFSNEVEQLNYLDLPQWEIVLISIKLLWYDEMSQYHTGAIVTLCC